MFGSSWVWKDGLETEAGEAATNSCDYGDASCVYPFGVDPAWHISGNELLFFNSMKMKSSVIIGILQMTLGICLKGMNGTEKRMAAASALPRCHPETTLRLITLLCIASAICHRPGAAHYFKEKLDLWFEFVPMMVFNLCFFGYMVVLIFLKWSIDWEARMYSATCNEDNHLWPECATTEFEAADLCPLDYGGTGDGCQPPNLITTLMNMALAPGVVAEPLYAGQASVQVALLLLAGVSVPVILIAKPLVLKSQMGDAGGAKRSSFSEVRRAANPPYSPAPAVVITAPRALEGAALWRGVPPRTCRPLRGERKARPCLETAPSLHTFTPTSALRGCVLFHSSLPPGGALCAKESLCLDHYDDGSGLGAQEELLGSKSLAHGQGGAHGAGHDEAGGHGGHDFSEVVIHQAIETIEFVLGMVSNTASYLRLWALSLAHSELATVFWEKAVISSLNSGNPVAVVAVRVHPLPRRAPSAQTLPREPSPRVTRRPSCFILNSSSHARGEGLCSICVHHFRRTSGDGRARVLSPRPAPPLGRVPE